MAVIGIDLGTTNSLAVYWNGDHAELIPNVFGEYLTPSVVSLSDEGELIVGKTAKERLVTHPAATAAGFKRFMGSDKVYHLNMQRYRPEELSAMVLKQLKADAELFLGEDIEEVIISVPAYFNDNSRTAVKNAGILAGLKVERLLNEPSAAALAYSGGKGDEDGQNYMVFDFGGGTLDISIVEQFENITEIIAVAGDNMLGGRDFDAAIAGYFYQETGLREDGLSDYTKASILRIAEQCKLELSEKEEVVMQVVVKDNPYQCAITREQLVKISGSLFNRIKKVIKKALADSRYTPADIDTILMVGGSGKMPVVREYLEYLTKQELCADMDPDLAVALGIGVAVGIKQRETEVRDLVLCDICPFTLGIQVVGENGQNLMSPIIGRNSILPSSKTELYHSMHINQKMVNIRILQGESRLAEENLEIGNLEIMLPQNNKIEHFNVTFSYDLNGLLNMMVKFHSSKKEYEKVVVNQSLKMSQEEIEQRVESLKSAVLVDRNKEEYQEVIARGNRLYEETSGALRIAVGEWVEGFEKILKTGDLIKIRKAFNRTDKFLKMVEVGQVIILPGELEEMYQEEDGEE